MTVIINIYSPQRFDRDFLGRETSVRCKRRFTTVTERGENFENTFPLLESIDPSPPKSIVNAKNNFTNSVLFAADVAHTHACNIDLPKCDSI